DATDGAISSTPWSILRHDHDRDVPVGHGHVPANVGGPGSQDVIARGEEGGVPEALRCNAALKRVGDDIEESCLAAAVEGNAAPGGVDQSRRVRIDGETVET